MNCVFCNKPASQSINYKGLVKYYCKDNEITSSPELLNTKITFVIKCKDAGYNNKIDSIWKNNTY